MTTDYQKSKCIKILINIHKNQAKEKKKPAAATHKRQ